MEKLIHKASGELVSEYPFRVLGMKLKATRKGTDKVAYRGVVTQESLEMYKDRRYERDGNIVWATWVGGAHPSYLRSHDYLVEVDS